MSKSKRVVSVAGLLVIWAVLVGLLRAFLSPVAGAATVAQLNAGDAGYLASMGILSAASMASVVVTIIFAILIVIVIRSEK